MNTDGILSKTISRMKSVNRKENARIRPRDVRKIIRRQLRTAHSELPVQDLEKLVEEIFPRAMQAYKGVAVLKPEVSDETKIILDSRELERRRIVRANKQRRKSDQPLSSSDKKWISKTTKIYKSDEYEIPKLVWKNNGLKVF